MRRPLVVIGIVLLVAIGGSFPSQTQQCMGLPEDCARLYPGLGPPSP